MMLAKNMITHRNEVFVTGKLHASNAVAIAAIVHSRTKDIHVLLVKIAGHGKRIALPPSVHTNRGHIHER